MDKKLLLVLLVLAVIAVVIIGLILLILASPFILAFLAGAFYLEGLPITSHQCVFTADFTCTSYALNANSGELNLTIRQETGHTINITGVSCTQNLSSNYMNETSINNYLNNPITISSGAQKIVSQPSTLYVTSCKDTTGNPPADMKAGSTYYGLIYINYTELDTGNSKIVKAAFSSKYAA